MRRRFRARLNLLEQLLAFALLVIIAAGFACILVLGWQVLAG